MLVKDILIASIGCAVGAVASYFVTKRAVENRCWNDYMGQREASKKAEKASESEKSDKNAEKSGFEVDKWRPDVTSADLLAARNASTGVAFDNGYYGADGSAKKLDPGANYIVDEPYIIDEDQYAESNEYESEELDWWTAAKFATTENGGGVVPDINELVGIDNVMRIEVSGESYGYVRNEKLKRDYVIHINNDEPPIFLEDD